MKFSFNTDGTLSFSANGKVIIPRSPVGMTCVDGRLCAPVSADANDDSVVLSFGDYTVTLALVYRADGSIRLEVADIPDFADGFVFGPYAVPEAVDFGEKVGAAWLPDGSAVCIQGLNTKTVGEIQFPFTNVSEFPSPVSLTAGKSGSTVVINCSCENMTRTKITSIPGISRFKANVVPAPEGLITGSAVILTFGETADELLDKIGEIEIEEGLPHPTINGEWAKKSKHANDIYLIFSNSNLDEQLEIAEHAGVHDIYFDNPFESWGHFGISKSKYPGGMDEFVSIINKAGKKGIRVGFHTLTNFIQTHDSYITPVPHDELLWCDETVITSDISESDTEIGISEALNYPGRTTLNAVRIGDEIFTYSKYDEEKHALVGCCRGAFGTSAAGYKCGTSLKRLIDHGYATLFPDIHLQHEMAKKIGDFIRTANMGRISFDGVEGCIYTGRGEYATAEFVKDVYDAAGSELLSDASNCSHYRWHAHAYFNNGEPWYDSDRRGGMFNFRARRQARYRANLIPGMLGWYVIWDSDGMFEPTLPETIESILARTIGYNAGLAFQVNAGYGDNVKRCCEYIKIWQEFKHASPAVPEDVLARMREKRTDWHLEKKDGRFILSEIECETVNLLRVDRCVITESGSAGYGTTQKTEEHKHRSMYIVDRSSAEEYPDIVEPYHARIRVGTPKDSGQLKGLAFCGGWFSESPIISFDVTANAGEYLEYNGGKTLYRYDRNYNLIETIESEGRELIYTGTGLGSYTLNYELTGDVVPVLTQIHSKVRYEF